MLLSTTGDAPSDAVESSADKPTGVRVTIASTQLIQHSYAQTKGGLRVSQFMGLPFENSSNTPLVSCATAHFPVKIHKIPCESGFSRL